jgi:hypothetical protein
MDVIYKEKPEDFKTLVDERRAWGAYVHLLDLEGEKVEKADFLDTSWETLEELADARIYLSFEETKLRVRESRAEARKVASWIRIIDNLAAEVYKYRNRVNEKFPELFENRVPEDEVRSDSTN